MSELKYTFETVIPPEIAKFSRAIASDLYQFDGNKFKIGTEDLISPSSLITDFVDNYFKPSIERDTFIKLNSKLLFDNSFKFPDRLTTIKPKNTGEGKILFLEKDDKKYLYDTVELIDNIYLDDNIPTVSDTLNNEYKLTIDINHDFFNFMESSILNNRKLNLQFRLPKNFTIQLVNSAQLDAYLLNVRIRKDSYASTSMSNYSNVKNKILNAIELQKELGKIEIGRIVSNNYMYLFNIVKNYSGYIYDYYSKAILLNKSIIKEFYNAINDNANKFQRFHLELASAVTEIQSVLKGGGVSLKPLTEKQKILATISTALSAGLQIYGSTGKPEIAIPLTILTGLGTSFMWR